MGDDPAHPSIDPALLRLPSGMAGSFDPVTENPFPPGTARHRLWEEATRDADLAVTRLRADWIAARQAWEPPNTIEEMVAWNAAYRESSLALLSAEFQTWAARGVQVVFSDLDVRSFDDWLVGYAEAVLRDKAQLMVRGGLATHLIEAELRTVKDRLAALVLHWKAEGRRVCELRRRDAVAAGHTNPPGGPGIVAPAALVARRRRLIQEYGRKHHLTREGVARRLGVSESALRGLIRDDRRRFNDATRDRVLATLGIPLTDWNGA